jgi:hypothetical protein
MKQITRLDYAMCVNHADAIGEDNLGFHAVDMGNVAVEVGPGAVVPSRPVLGINERQSVVGGTAGNRDLPLPSEAVSFLRAKFARRAEKHRAEEKRSGQTPSHGNESITGVSQARPNHGRSSALDARETASTSGRGQGRLLLTATKKKPRATAGLKLIGVEQTNGTDWLKARPVRLVAASSANRNARLRWMEGPKLQSVM